MSFTDKLILWLHIAVAIFAIGPVTLAISSTPRSIRRRDVPILRYLSRVTLTFTAVSLLVLVFGIVAGEQEHALGKPWLTVAMTLFVVAIVLLVLIIRDQRRAIRALVPAEVAGTGGDGAGRPGAPAVSANATVPEPALATAGAGDAGPESAAGGSAAGGNAGGGSSEAGPAASAAGIAEHVASVERGRIAAMGGVVNLIWLVILVLMVWRP